MKFFGLAGPIIASIAALGVAGGTGAGCAKEAVVGADPAPDATMDKVALNVFGMT